jgi:hypothetical protein
VCVSTVLSLFAGVRFQDPSARSKNLRKSSLRQNNVIFLVPFRNMMIRDVSFLPQQPQKKNSLKIKRYWLEDLCELTNKPDAPIHRRVLVSVFILGGDPVKREELVYSRN